MFGIGSALGQASGAVLSRKADEVGTLAGLAVDGGTAAYQRVLGGILITAIAFLCTRRLRPPAATLEPQRWQRGWPLVAANALFGPTIGVSCYQWALLTTPSGIVLPIVATSPLATMLLVWAIESERPSRRAILGGVLAVGGAAALKLVQTSVP
jgi:drug/metabolite transporter (DMT)-like permease